MSPLCRRTATMLVRAAILSWLCLSVPAASPGFKAAPDGGFAFDTGALRGRLRAGGKSMGLQEVTQLPTGRRIDRSNGLLSPYRVFTVGRRYGDGVWDWPGTARLREDGAVEVTWPAADGRPFELNAVYRIRDAATVDLETTVKAGADLVGFEVFVASYFDERFTNATVAAASPAGPGAGAGAGAGAAASFVRATADAGAWQIFPRDEAALGLIRDGRWKLEPHPVEWVERPWFGRPLARRRAPASGLSGLLMAPPSDCFAVSLPHETEGHYSVYLSLFGRTVKAGESAVARMRLMVVAAKSDAAVLALHDEALRGWTTGKAAD